MPRVDLATIDDPRFIRQIIEHEKYDEKIVATQPWGNTDEKLTMFYRDSVPYLLYKESSCGLYDYAWYTVESPGVLVEKFNYATKSAHYNATVGPRISLKTSRTFGGPSSGEDLMGPGPTTIAVGLIGLISLLASVAASIQLT